MILDEILAHKRIEIEALKKSVQAPSVPTVSRRDFAGVLRKPGQMQLIAEIKRRSPSRGDIKACLNPALLALDYEEAGAAAISVLADEQFFGGSLSDLYKAKAVVDLPVLRKDFILDEVQIWQSVDEDGPDAILLIVAALVEERLAVLLAEAKKYGIACLVETHAEAEVETALRAGAEIIGINNRDLKTFQVDLRTTERLRRFIPNDRIVVSESGIHARADVERLRDIGVDAMLVGEALLAHADPMEKVRELLGRRV